MLFTMFTFSTEKEAQATHSMGMEISYEWLGGLDYEFTLLFYYDCNATFPAPGSVNLGINSSSCAFSTTTNLPLVSGPTDITPVCPTTTTNCNGGIVSGVEQYIYRGTYTLPGACPDWIFSYSLCCRNNMITNLNAPGSQQLYVESRLDNTLAQNSSPSFSSIPTLYICSNQYVVFTNGAWDSDGDSISYSLVNALGAGGAPLTYSAGYSATYPITTTTGTMPFDAQTGTMDFTPNGTQVCVVAVRADEYRGGNFIGSTMRDVQVVVTTCPANNLPIIPGSAITNLVGGTQVDSNSVTICAGVDLSFDIVATDADAGDVLSFVTNIAQSMPGATWTTTGTNPITGSFSWTPPTNADVGYHPFAVTVLDDACPYNGKQIYPFDVTVLQSTYAGPDVTICAGGADSTQLTATGATTYTWSPTTGLSNPFIANPWAMPATTTTFTVTTDYVGPCFATDDVVVTVTPQTGPITGLDSVCTNDNGVAYSVPNNPGSTYTWTITGGTQASGGTSNSITVDWGPTGMVGMVQVLENPSCSGGPISIPVNIHTLPTSAITGSTSLAINTAGEVYSVTNTPGYSYAWTVPGGTIVAGAGTSSITVDWGGTAGTYTVQCVASSGCGAAAAVTLDVDLYDIIESIASGNWNNAGTWDCSCNPPSGASVRINDGHTVTMQNNERINNIIITDLGLLFNNGNRFRVDGNYTVNGIHNTDNERIQLRASGPGMTIDGTGVITNIRNFQIRNQDYTIPASADLTFNCSPNREVRMYNDITVTNNGSVTIFGDLDDRSNGCSWVNGPNATFNISDELFVRNGWGILDASANGNTVNYNGTVNQDIKVPVSSYFNLHLTGSASKEAQADLDVNGDILIDNTATFDVSTNNVDVTVAGDWTNIASTFSPGTRSVTFDGSALQTITAASGETYNDVTVLAGANVYVPVGTSATVQGALSNSGSIDNDGIITMNNGYAFNSGALSGDGIHELAGGNWNNTGSFTEETSTVLFSGTAAQTILGATTFYNLTIDNTVSVSILGDQHNVLNAMMINNGTFNTNNGLTFISNILRTAYLGTIQPGGDIIGDITMQRYINSTATSWRHMGSATTGQTLADWGDDFATSGFPGSDAPGWSFVSIYRYDETVNGTYDNWAAYTPATNITNPILDDEGYWVYVGPVPLTFETEGPASKFGETFNVSYTDFGSVVDDGWCLVPNPYPCAIDWDAGSGWTRTNIDNAVYIWNPSNQSYSTYITGIGLNGGSRYIPSQAAFYVKANAAGAGMSCDENVKSNSEANQGTYRSIIDPGQQLIILGMTGAAETDELAVRLHIAATDTFDNEYDAYKLASSEPTMHNFSTVWNGLDYSINSLPKMGVDISIPIRATVGVSGTYAIEPIDLSGIDPTSCVILEDLETGVMTDLRVDAYYPFYIEDTTVAPRFVLHISAPIMRSVVDVSCHGANDGSATVQGNSTGPWDYTWTDLFGNVIQSTTGSMDADSINGLSPGQYIVTVMGSPACGANTDTITIIEPDVLYTDMTAIEPPCHGDEAVALATVYGGAGDYTYSWSNGATTDQVNNLNGGTYHVTVTDANQCTVTDSVVIEEPDPLALMIYSTAESNGECDGAVSALVYGGTAGYSFTWNQLYTTQEMTGLCEGLYVVEVLDANGCFTSDSVYLRNVIDPKDGLGYLIAPNPADDQFMLVIDLTIMDVDRIRLLDVTGRIITDQDISDQLDRYETTMDVSQLSRGIYLLQLIAEDEMTTVKIQVE